MHRLTAKLLLAASLTTAAFAADGTFANLTTTGLVDFNGQTLAFGSIDATNPAFTLNYAANAISYASPLTTANWYWLQKTSEYQLALTSANQLKLYDATLKTVAITLDPSAASIFTNGLTINGALSAQGGLTLPTTGTTAAQGLTFGDTNLYRSAAATLKTDKNLQVGQNLSVSGPALSLGTNATTTAAGLTTTYTDGNPTATVTNAVSRPGAIWNFKQNATTTQLQLDATNKLTLYNPSTAAANVVLDPANRSAINNGLTVSNGLTVASGNVGMGTANPDAKLVVDGGGFNNIALRDDSLENHKAGGDSAGVCINYVGYNGGASYYRDFSVFNGKGGQLVRVQGSTGNVGIGTSTPTATLEVTGTFTVSGDVKIKTVLRVPPAGDLSMGTFTTGTNPSL